MTRINELDNIPSCCLTCENHDCFKDLCFGTRKFADAVEEDEEDPTAPTGFRKVLKEELFGIPKRPDKGICRKTRYSTFP